MNQKFINFLLVISLLVPLILFSYNAYNTYGYDDEYFNIPHVNSFNSSFDLVKTHLSGEFIDIHPFGQYLINYWLIKIFKSWPLVRVAGAFVVALSLWLFWRYITIKNIKDITALIFSYIFICLNPSALLWCTGVRWYTYLLPLVSIMAYLGGGIITALVIYSGDYIF